MTSSEPILKLTFVSVSANKPLELTNRKSLEHIQEAMQIAADSLPEEICTKKAEMAVASFLALTTSADVLKNISQLPMVSIRKLDDCAAELYNSNPEAAVLLYGQYKGGLVATIKNCGIQYFRANSVSLSEEDIAATAEACASYVREKFASFSLAEVKQAFIDATALPEMQAYGQLSVQMVHNIMTSYANARGRYLVAVQDTQRILADAELITAKNQAAAEVVHQELLALRVENKKYASWHLCPTKAAEVLKKYKGIELIVCGIDFDEMKADASSKAYYDFLQAARWQGGGKAKDCIAFIKAFGAHHKLLPMPSGNSEGKIRGVYPFVAESYTYKNITKAFLAYFNNILAKMTYFHSIAPYTGGVIEENPAADSMLQMAESAAMRDKNEAE